MIVVLPVSILVFFVGFSAGAARVRVADEKVRDLESFLSDLMGELEKGASFSFEHLDSGRIKSCLEAIEHMKSNVVGSIVGEILNGHLDFDLGGMKKMNSKSGKKRKELDFVQYLSGLFQENVIGTRTTKAKDNSKGEAVEQSNSVAKTNPALVGSGKKSVFGNEIENQEIARIEESELMFNKNQGKLKEGEDKGKVIKTALGQDSPVRNIEELMNDKKSHRAKDSRYVNDMLSYEEELDNLNKSFRFMTKQESFQRRVFKHNYERRSLQRDVGRYTHSGTDNRTAASIDFFSTESEASSLLEETLEISDKTYDPQNRSKTSNLIKELRAKSEDPPVKATQKPEPTHVVEKDNMSSSPTISVDEEFSQYVEEAINLLKQARECMKRRADEETADSILYKSAQLFSAAEAMRPMSLLVVGQLGNTYLLHGELKLKISRELRTLLLRNDASLTRKGRVVQFKKLNTRELSREGVESTLVEVCEECEELLVEAGRKYRTALSIDGNDVRALYNWGLALTFRAQLIADIGPEVALDADKIYLAAIDKFDAMMSRSNLYATDALYRWGTVLQQRSYLRPRNNREKMKLLYQAKSLFEDVLSLESDNLQVREALVSCVSELKDNGQW